MPRTAVHEARALLRSALMAATVAALHTSDVLETDARGLSLMRGPLHRLGARLGLVRGRLHTIPLGIALGVGTWLVLATIAAFEGRLRVLFGAAGLGAHLRLLVVVPLFFVCESRLEPRLAEVVPTLLRSGIIPSSSRAPFDALLRQTRNMLDGTQPELACLAIAVALTLSGPSVNLLESGAGTQLAAIPSFTAAFYWGFCLTLFRFVMLRWLARILVWSFFLWKLGRLELHLVPTHPDGAAGLGYFEVVAIYFGPLAFAFSAIFATSFAEGVRDGVLTRAAFPWYVALVLTFEALLFIGPFAMLAPKLWSCRVKGLADYMELAARYTNGFDQKWNTPAESDDALLGTPDLQSLADLGSSVAVVRDMRWLPLSRRSLIELAAAALLPMLPVLLLWYPLTELARHLFTALTGL